MYSISQCCFLCLQHVIKDYDLKKGNISLQEIIQFCCCQGLQVDEDKKIPMFLCSSCRKHLITFYTFKKIIVKSYNRWQKYVLDLKHNSTTGNQENANLKILLVDIKQKCTEIELLENSCPSYDNKTKFDNTNISHSVTLTTRKIELPSDTNETFNTHENNKNEYEIKSEKEVTNNTELFNKNLENPNILNNKIKTESNNTINYNIDLYVGNEIKKTNSVTENKMKETQNENVTINLQYEIIFSEDSKNIKSDFNDGYTDFELSNNKMEYIETTINDTDLFEINEEKYNNKIDLDDDGNIIETVNEDLQSLSNMNEESLAFPFTIKREITNEKSSQPILLFNSTSLEAKGNFSNSINENGDFRKNCSNLYNCKSLNKEMKYKETIINNNEVKNEVSIKSEIDKYLDSLTSIYIMQEESLDVPFDIKDEPIQTDSEEIDENSLISENNFSTNRCNNERAELDENSTNRNKSNKEKYFVSNNSDRNQDSANQNKSGIHDRKIEDESNLHICPICKNQFARRPYLKRHINTVHSEKRFTCAICNKTFKRKDHLKDHVKIHSRKPYCCTICKKHFSLNHHLNEHIKIHSGDKQFKCEVCTKTFIQKSNYKAHYRIHTGEKPFSCSFCEKPFSNSNVMLRHQRIHTLDYKHKCSMCDKKFYEISKLKRHLKVHQKNKLCF